MAVFRVERTQNYTIMSNYHLRDKSISLKAKGLLSQMLSLPEDWDYTLTGLAKINQEGKDASIAARLWIRQENSAATSISSGSALFLYLRQGRRLPCRHRKTRQRNIRRRAARRRKSQRK